MFLRILKKDLKRKKTMNIILLLFVILCSMFAAAAVNNIIAVTGGIEHYFDAADVPDVNVQMVNSGEDDLWEKVGELAGVREIRTERWLVVSSSKYFRHNGKKLDNFANVAYLLSDREMAVNYFDENNHIIESVDRGCFYASASFLQDIDIKEGDEVELDVGESHLTLKFMGRFKGALFHSGNSYPPYLIVNSADYDYLDKDEATHSMNCGQLCVNTSDVDEIRELVKNYSGVLVNTREECKSIYLYDMFLAYILMLISIVLMFTVFVVLRFTIGFTISEEFCEIGVMKAVGIDNGSIRSLYIVKYLVITVVGTLIGCFCSVPLGDMMMKTVSENMVLGSGNGTLMGLLSSGLVAVIILLFCYGCTRRVNKLSPIDAVRNGQHSIAAVNGVLGVLFLLMIGLLYYIRGHIIVPFGRLNNVPQELARGNLAVPIPEEKSRFFGKFTWGVSLLRESIEDSRKKEIAMQRDKKLLLLSLSHDIKTPLSAIKLGARALARGLYKDEGKRRAAAESISTRADEIERFISEITKAASEDFMNFEVTQGEAFLSAIITKIDARYAPQLAMSKTEFVIQKFDDCILTCDSDRLAECLQNLIENAIKYGDSRRIEISFDKMDGCELITVSDTGCTLEVKELPQIFESFHRGNNAERVQGNGLGLFICRRLMGLMNGEVYAEIRDGCFYITLVVKMA